MMSSLAAVSGSSTAIDRVNLQSKACKACMRAAVILHVSVYTKHTVENATNRHGCSQLDAHST